MAEQKKIGICLRDGQVYLGGHRKNIGTTESIVALGTIRGLWAETETGRRIASIGGNVWTEGAT